jgi:hypothetical protein
MTQADNAAPATKRAILDAQLKQYRAQAFEHRLLADGAEKLAEMCEDRLKELEGGNAPPE